MVTLATVPNSALKQGWSRLLVACLLSLLLHLALLLGVAVNPTGGVSNVAATIYARLEPAANSEAQLREATLTPAKQADVPLREGTRHERPADKAGPQRESRQAAIELPSAPVAGVELPSSRDPTYYTARQLDVYPRPLEPIKLDYPDRAAAQRIDGILLLMLLIDEFGLVNEASVVEANPEGHFEAAALAVFRAARFSPAQKLGQPVKSRVLMQIRYRYGDADGAAR